MNEIKLEKLLEKAKLKSSIKKKLSSACEDSISTNVEDNESSELAVKKRKKNKRKHNENQLTEPKAESSLDVENPDVNESGTCGLSIIGGHNFHPAKKIKSFVPNWLANAVTVSTDLSNLTVKVKKCPYLDSELVKVLKRKGISKFFPIQAETIPWIISNHQKNDSMFKHCAPRDLCVSAPTGSGKTLCFVLPIIQCLKSRLVPKIRALIVVPVRELAHQIYQVFVEYCELTDLRVHVSTGGSPLSSEKAVLGRTNDSDPGKIIDILVTTPGRLVEHLENTQGFDLSGLEFVVIDEADRVVENIQDNWLHCLAKHMRSVDPDRKTTLTLKTLHKRKIRPQMLLFSATLTKDPEKLKVLNLFQPKLFTSVAKNSTNSGPSEELIHKYSTPEELTELYMEASPVLKPLVICDLVQKGWNRILCFTKSAEDAHKLSLLLGFLIPKYTIAEISSSKPVSERQNVLKDFTTGVIDILVSSDVMARGIDIPEVKYVISYDPPKHIKGYIHRAGRTGRAGMQGTALTLGTSVQIGSFLQKLKLSNISVEQLTIEDLSLNMDDYKRAIQLLKEHIDKENAKQVQKLKRKKRHQKPSKAKRKKH